MNGLDPEEQAEKYWREVAILDSIKSGEMVLVPTKVTTAIMEVMHLCENGELSFREGWKLLLDAAQDKEESDILNHFLTRKR